MTETRLTSESNSSNGIPELITRVEKVLENVQLQANNTEYTNRDLVALTVEVETLREDLGDTLTTAESESRKRGLTVAFVGTTVGAVQVTDTHIETCRINPIIHRFQKDHGLSPKEEFFCDVSFPTHNHGQLSEIGHGLHSANYVGIVLYSVIALGFLWWWMKARHAAKSQRKKRAERDKRARETAKVIFNGPSHNKTQGVVDDLEAG